MTQLCLFQLYTSSSYSKLRGHCRGRYRSEVQSGPTGHMPPGRGRRVGQWTAPFPHRAGLCAPGIAPCSGQQGEKPLPLCSQGTRRPDRGSPCLKTAQKNKPEARQPTEAASLRKGHVGSKGTLNNQHPREAVGKLVPFITNRGPPAPSGPTVGPGEYVS